MMLRRWIACLFVFFALGCGVALAENAPAAPADETARLIEALKDPVKRDELLRQLEILRAAQMLDTAKSDEVKPKPANRSIADAITSLTGVKPATPQDTAPAQSAAVSEEGSVEAEPQGSGALVTLESMVGEIRNNLADSWSWLLGLKNELLKIDRITDTPKFRAFWAALSWELLAILAAASLVGGVSHYLLRGPTRRLLGHAQSVGKLVWRNALGVVLRLLPALLFGLTGYTLVIALNLGATSSLVTMALINAQTAVLLIMAVGSLDFAVARGKIMPGWFTDEAAAFLRSSVLQLAVTLSYGVMMIELADAMGVDAALIRLLIHVVGFITIAIALYTIHRLRKILALHEQVEEAAEIEAQAAGADNPAQTIATRSIAKAEDSLRRNWASFATLGVLGFYLLWMIAPVDVLMFCLRGAMLTIVVTILARALMRLTRRAFARAVAEEGKAHWWNSGPWRHFRFYIDMLRRAVLAILLVLAGILILQVWGVDFMAWLASPAGQYLTGRLVTIVLIIIAGIVVAELFSIAVENHMQRHKTDYSDISRRSRARTLLPLLKNVVRVALGTIIILLILAELGIEIGPLLAAAGVVGVAIGFGAQTLVKDIITGIFILIEDTIAVGDVVDLEGNSGVVEGMTIRSVRLRDAAGTVHTIPFSAITKVMNMTRDFSYAVFDINIAYDQDIQQVIDVVQAIGAEMRKDPKFARDILEPIEIQGVDRFADSAVVIKARIKTKPIRQWEIGRAFNWRLKTAFDAAGIEIPFPQRTMHIISPKKDTVADSDGPAANPSPFTGG